MKKQILLFLAVIAFACCNNPAVVQQDTPLKMGAVIEYHTAKFKIIGGGAEIWMPNVGTTFKAGDTVAIKAGTYTTITFGNVTGARADSIVFINYGGLVKSNYIKFTGSKFFKLTGSGTDGIYRGFNAAIICEKNSAYRVNRCEPTDCNVGIFMVQKAIAGDSTTWFDNYRSVGVIIDDNYLHRIHGEGMYIGRSTLGPDDEYPAKYPIWMDSVFIFNNIVDSCDWDGIQTSNTRYTKIFGNYVTNYGLINKPSQQGGIVGGGNTFVEIFNNYVANGTGNGIQGFGYWTSIHDNTLDKCGTSPGQQSIITNNLKSEIDPAPVKQNVRIYNNSISNPNTNIDPSTGARPNAIKVFAEVANFEDSAVVVNNKISVVNAPSGWVPVVINFKNQRVTGNVSSGGSGGVVTPPADNVTVTVFGSVMSRVLNIPYKIKATSITSRQIQFSKDGTTWETSGLLKPINVTADSATLPYGTTFPVIYVRVAVVANSKTYYSSTLKL